MDKKIITNEMREALRAPLPSAAVKPNPTKAYLSVIKPIYVIERLNDVFGIGTWRVKTDLVTPISSETKENNNRKRVEFTSLMKTILEIPEYGIYYECIAGSTNEDEGDSAKGGTTDGITKIASWMEIGIEIFKGNGNVQAPAPTQQTSQNKPMNAAKPAQPTDAPASYQKHPQPATDAQKKLIIDTVQSSVFTEAERHPILDGVDMFSTDKAKKCIDWLLNEMKTRKANQTA